MMSMLVDVVFLRADIPKCATGSHQDKFTRPVQGERQSQQQPKGLPAIQRERETDENYPSDRTKKCTF
jgi:hypothetical protein